MFVLFTFKQSSINEKLILLYLNIIVIWFQIQTNMLLIFYPFHFFLSKGGSTDQSFTVYLSIFMTTCSCSQDLTYSSGVSDLRLEHHDSTESADPLQGMVNHSPVRVIVNQSTVAQMADVGDSRSKGPGIKPLIFQHILHPQISKPQLF